MLLKKNMGGIYLTRNEFNEQVQKTLEFFEKAGIVLTEKEKQSIEVIDFNQGKVKKFGLQLLVYLNTQRVCAKEMVLLPGQTCAEHWHVPTNGQQGKGKPFAAVGVRYTFM